jgi:hypothetical protein
LHNAKSVYSQRNGETTSHGKLTVKIR